MDPVDELNLLLGIGPKKHTLPITLQRSGYVSVRCLGKGGFGQAHLIFHSESQQYYVAKHINMACMSSKQKKEAHREIEILQSFDNPNIVRYVECFEEPPNLYIIMEYADGGDLYSHLKTLKTTGRRLTEEQVVNLFSQLALAVRYLHTKKVLHRDIKAANVFLTKAHVVKLGDFGISTVLQNTIAMAKTMCGTPAYFSPELCLGKTYNSKSDVWALGCLLYEICTGGKLPFDSPNMKRLMDEIVHKPTPQLPAALGYSQGLNELMCKMLAKDPVHRPDMNSVLHSPAIAAMIPGIVAQLGGFCPSPRRHPPLAARLEHHLEHPAPSAAAAVDRFHQRQQQQQQPPPPPPRQFEAVRISAPPQHQQQQSSPPLGGESPLLPHRTQQISAHEQEQQQQQLQQSNNSSYYVRDDHQAVMLAERMPENNNSNGDDSIRTDSTVEVHRSTTHLQQQQQEQGETVASATQNNRNDTTGASSSYRYDPVLLRQSYQSSDDAGMYDSTDPHHYQHRHDHGGLAQSIPEEILGAVNSDVVVGGAGQQHSGLISHSLQLLGGDGAVEGVGEEHRKPNTGKNNSKAVGDVVPLATVIRNLRSVTQECCRSFDHSDGAGATPTETNSSNSDHSREAPVHPAPSPADNNAALQQPAEDFQDQFLQTLDVEALQSAAAQQLHEQQEHRRQQQQQQHSNASAVRSSYCSDRSGGAAVDPADVISEDDAEDEEESITFSGSCLCGSLCFRAYLSHIYGSFTCDCHICKRFSGSNKGVSWLHLPEITFADVLTDESIASIRAYVIPGTRFQCFFCTNCGSSAGMRHEGIEGCVIAKCLLSEESAAMLERNEHQEPPQK